MCATRYSVKKLFKLPDGSVLGGAGLYDDIAEVAAWLMAGGDETKRPTLQGTGEDGPELVIVDPDGTPYWLTWPFLRKIRIEESIFAIGSGNEYAIGAMASGKSARQAIEIATRYDKNTGRGVDVIRIAPTKAKKDA